MQSEGDTFYGNQSSSGDKIIYLKDTKGPKEWLQKIYIVV